MQMHPAARATAARESDPRFYTSPGAARKLRHPWFRLSVAAAPAVDPEEASARWPIHMPRGTRGNTHCA